MKTETLFLEGLNDEVTFHIGQNQNENFNVIDMGSPMDLWFHAENISSCHVIAIIPEDISNKDLKYIIKAGANLCKKYTNKLKLLKNVVIVYTHLKNIEKTNVKGCVNIKNEKKIVV